MYLGVAPGRAAPPEERALDRRRLHVAHRQFAGDVEAAGVVHGRAREDLVEVRGDDAAVDRARRALVAPRNDDRRQHFPGGAEAAHAQPDLVGGSAAEALVKARALPAERELRQIDEDIPEGGRNRRRRSHGATIAASDDGVQARWTTGGRASILRAESRREPPTPEEDVDAGHRQGVAGRSAPGQGRDAKSRTVRETPSAPSPETSFCAGAVARRTSPSATALTRRSASSPERRPEPARARVPGPSGGYSRRSGPVARLHHLFRAHDAVEAPPR